MALTQDELTVLQLIAIAGDRSYESICDRFAGGIDDDDDDDAIMKARLRFRRTVRGLEKKNLISYPRPLTADTPLTITDAGDDALEAEHNG